MNESKGKNRMKEIRIEKVTVNMGVGKSGEELEKAKEILEKITGSKAVKTVAKVKQPKWEIRPGLEIGVKVTLRKKKALEFLKKALSAKDNKLKEKQFDNNGNFGFGIGEYIDLPGVKYDPRLGIRGMDVLVTLERPGYRVKKRKIEKARIGKNHLISKTDAIDSVKKIFGVSIA